MVTSRAVVPTLADTTEKEWFKKKKKKKIRKKKRGTITQQRFRACVRRMSEALKQNEFYSINQQKKKHLLDFRACAQNRPLCIQKETKEKKKLDKTKSKNPAQHLLHNINITVKILYSNRHICELQI